MDLKELRKGDDGEVALATLVRARTGVGNAWVAARLHMGHNRSVSHLIRQGPDDATAANRLEKPEEMLPCED